MANIKSAKKRVLVNQKKADRNKSIKSAVKTSIKKVEAAVVAKDKEAAVAALANAISTIDKAATKGVYHKNNAARKVSRLSKAVNTTELILIIKINLKRTNGQPSLTIGSFYFDLFFYMVSAIASASFSTCAS